MKAHVWLVLIPILCCLLARPAPAETVVEAWRSEGFLYPRSVSVNPTDGSCWAADDEHNQVVHLSATGVELWRGGGFNCPDSVSVNPTDGSCWVADMEHHQVVHLSESGAELWRGGGFLYPESVSVNPTDGSCWVADSNHNQVVHLSANGTELWRGGEFTAPWSVSVNPTDSSCWVAVRHTNNNQVVHLSESGAELWRGGFDRSDSVSVNPTDGSCWVAGGSEVFHLAATGSELWRGSGFGQGWSSPSVSVNPIDGSCWVADRDNGQVVHLSESGAELWRGGGFYSPYSVSVNPTDGSCWVADTLNNQVVHLVIQTDFDDVPYYHWAFHQIEACYVAGIVQGYLDGTYGPTNSVTRDQMAVYISRALAAGDENVLEFTGTPTFPDVPSEPEPFWALDYVEYAVSQNVVAGYDDGLYHPEYEVTRDQMAVYIARSIATPTGEAGLAGYVPADPRNFPDVPNTGYGDDGTEPFWAYTHVEYCVENGVVQGYLDGYYYPGNVVTRDQMAVYVARAFGLGM